ncbi:hypothetical protein [Bacillus amyloliquefaciens]|uniref:hypothetical protein n=1 Tax=Bacillus amyloliquefaciens TaxID=1390 RepID=UPI00140519C7|nr:hypothetical protein [Bacillus amyloliquefaciens]NHN22379.1 hypothetical protein [Bacillus amyloliquefaciens]
MKGIFMFLDVDVQKCSRRKKDAKRSKKEQKWSQNAKLSKLWAWRLGARIRRLSASLISGTDKIL